ncbi:hypothetical protein BCR37DRAFT_244421 [Protomyces lactucae-debilis]|uniref:Uncharacterized protein n=1 Tax=Protomyces lactucae-debilis TaxID=2754530 RepID=A0A1Y2FNX3_PROLT|nr:uncharacterized protein BCR37DRAFT_244421 [Protomyces lactucae-debilis]ORY85629.1 hypothetical protein BCR37DRAFT_244421 [Protomyces lactucae-debilis]
MSRLPSVVVVHALSAPAPLRVRVSAWVVSLYQCVDDLLPVAVSDVKEAYTVLVTHTRSPYPVQDSLLMVVWRVSLSLLLYVVQKCSCVIRWCAMSDDMRGIVGLIA